MAQITAMLLDTSGLFCLFRASDRQHNEARRLFDGAPTRLTHNYVIAEFVALADSRRAARQELLDFVSSVYENRLIKVIHVSEDLHYEAFEMLVRRRDKHWSLCDAVSFALMETDNITEALTTDHHFVQAGFKCLLQPS